MPQMTSSLNVIYTSKPFSLAFKYIAIQVSIITTKKCSEISTKTLFLPVYIHYTISNHNQNLQAFLINNVTYCSTKNPPPFQFFISFCYNLEKHLYLKCEFTPNTREKLIFKYSQSRTCR